MGCKMGEGTVDEALKALILVIKENIKVRRFASYEAIAPLTFTAAAPTALSLSSIPPMKLLLSRSSLSLARILQCRSLLQTRAT